MTTTVALLLALVLLGTTRSAFGQSAEDMNNSNNPLTPAVGVNVQDQYVGSYYGLPGADSNTGLIRGILPHKLFSWPQILRAMVPIVTSPRRPPRSDQWARRHQHL